jgi:hypothetical protein
MNMLNDMLRNTMYAKIFALVLWNVLAEHMSERSGSCFVFFLVFMAREFVFVVALLVAVAFAAPPPLPKVP